MIRILNKFHNIIPFTYDLNFVIKQHLNLNSYFFEFLLCCAKLMIFLKIIFSYGFLQGVFIIFLISNSLYYLLKIIFKLDKLTPNDLLILAYKDEYRNDMICVFFFEFKFDPEKIRDILINKGIKKNEKFQKKLVRIFSTFFWQTVAIEEAEKRVKIMKQEFVNKDAIIEYLRKEVNNPIVIEEEMPYEFKLMKYSGREGGAIMFKNDHSFSDGLGMVLFTLTICDGYDDSYIPHLLKQMNSIPFYYKLIRYFSNLVLFPYYSIKLLFNSQVHKSQNNPFTRNSLPSNQTVFASTSNFEFTKLNVINKNLKITFNDLMLSILSSAISKFCVKYYPDRFYLYDYLICAIPIGLKTIPKSTSDVRLANDILGAILPLKRIQNPLEEYKKVSEETKRTVRNNLNTTGSRYLFTILNEFLPYQILRDIAKKVGDSCDLGISNMPGPVKRILYDGCAVDDMFPVLSLGFGKAFIIIGTYNNKVKIVVNVDPKLNIDVSLLANTIQEEIIMILKSH